MRRWVFAWAWMVGAVLSATPANAQRLSSFTAIDSATLAPADLLLCEDVSAGASRKLTIGDLTTYLSGVLGGGSGDITAVGDCASGDCFQSVGATEFLAGPGGGGVAAFRAITDADVPDTITVSLASAATALAANGADCSPGNYPLGVDASGAAESCTADDDVPEAGDFSNLALTGDVTSSGLNTTIPSGTVGITELGDDASCTGSQVVRRNAGDTAFECATASGGADNVPEGRLDGYYSLPGVFCSGSTAIVSSSGARIYYEPFYVPTQITVTGLAIGVTTASAGETVHLCIYNADADLKPTTLVVDGGALDISSTGTKESTVSQVLAVGRYMKALVVPSGTPAFRFLSGCGPTLLGTDATSNTQVLARWLYVDTAYGACASTAVAWDTANFSSTGFQHAIRLKVGTP